MKLISWNVNGIRAVMKKGFREYVQKERPDILCLQEVKASEEQVQLDLPSYQAYWNAAQKKGYSGVVVLSTTAPLSVQSGLGNADHDGEGRLLTLEFPDFFLVNVYTPNSQRGLTRLAYRTQEWDGAFLRHLKKLERKKPVLVCGDLNVAHKEIDIANPKTNVKNAGFTPEERAGMDRLVASGFVDAFRLFEKEGGHYSWWAPFANARARNIGWRIDYWLVSQALVPRVKAAGIQAQVMGSDHAPVTLVLE